VGIFRYGAQVCGSLSAGAAREWLVVDGLGGYAMGTASGLRTRRYHGLLVVANAGGGSVRRMALASLDPVLTLPSGARTRLGTHEWASGTVDPPGHTMLEFFEVRDGLPRWRWRVGDVVVERTLAMRHGHASVAVVHTVLAGGPVRLTLEPLCTWRDAHGERFAAGGDLRIEPTADGFAVEDAYRVAGPGFEPDGAWYHGVRHREEAARGLNPVEDLFRPGRFAATVDTGATMEVSAWSGDLDTAPPPARDVVAAARRRAAALAPADADETTQTLTRAADAFIVAGPDVVAGYPWFGAWSRDTMISYEGLFLATGRADEGRELLRAYTATLSAGMLANTADTGRTEHNTADATLWYLHAVGRHVSATGDVDLAA
jgi:predicted glycogen debranching enzyme